MTVLLGKRSMGDDDFAGLLARLDEARVSAIPPRGLGPMAEIHQPTFSSTGLRFLRVSSITTQPLVTAGRDEPRVQLRTPQA